MEKGDDQGAEVVLFHRIVKGGGSYYKYVTGDDPKETTEEKEVEVGTGTNSK